MGLLTGTDQNYYEASSGFGNYQFTSLEDIINQFMVVYVGEGKIISKARKTDVAFHAQRAMQELSFDTFKSIKSQEITLPPSNTMLLPRDYVNYTKLAWSDSSGIEHVLYPTSKTSNPFKIRQDSDGTYDFSAQTGSLNIVNPNFSSALIQPWFRNPAVNNSISTSVNVTTTSALSDILEVISEKLQISTNPFAFTNNNPASPITTGRAYAVWQEITVTDIDELSITATGSSAAEVSGEASAGILRIGISTTPGDPNTNLQKNNPGTNDQIVSGGYNGPNFLPGTNSTTSNTSFPNANGNNEVLEWNNVAGETDITKTLENIDVVGHDTLYVLITSHTPFLSLSANISTNTIDTISVGYEGVSPNLPLDNENDGDSTTWTNYKSATPSENQDDYQDDTYWPNNQKRYGLDPQHAQVNGSFYIDNLKGLINFSSNVSGKTVILDYISDSLGTDGEMQVHKFAEEAMYKWIMYAILSTRANTQEYIVQRYKKEKFAATRQAKLRLSNIKLEELTQILRGKSKHIKH